MAAMKRRDTKQKLEDYPELLRFCRVLVVWSEKHPDGRLSDFLSFYEPPTREMLALDTAPMGNAIVTRK